MWKTIGVRIARTLQLTWMMLWRYYMYHFLLERYRWFFENRPINDNWLYEIDAFQLIKVLLIINVIIVFICGVSIRAFPIIRLIAWLIPRTRGDFRSPLVFLPSWRGIPARIKARRIASGAYGQELERRRNRRELKTPVRSLGSVDRPSGRGVMTGFEPVAMTHVSLPKGEMVVGVPGAGLHSSGFEQGRIDAGVKGEETFAKALVKAGLDRKFLTMWSVKIPHYDTDVDCVIFADDVIFLVDIKYYRSGDVTYRSTEDTIYCIDNATHAIVGEPKSMSRNMKMAKDIFSKTVSTFSTNNTLLAAVVVFVPTDNGQPQVENVVWPGGVPAMALPEFLKMLKHQNAYDGHGSTATWRKNFADQVSYPTRWGGVG